MLRCIDTIKQAYYRILNTIIEHSSNKIITSMLFILEHNTSIKGSMKSIIGKNFGKFPKAHWANFEHNNFDCGLVLIP